MDQISQESRTAGLGQRAVSSAVILSARRVLFQFIITGSGIVLARLLFPEVFGVFAILSFLVFIFTHLGDIGLSQALVQQDVEPTVRQLRGVFTVQLLLALISALLLWLLAPLVAGLYGPELPEGSVRMLRLLGLTLPLGVPGSISSRLLERHLLYKRFALGEFIQLFVSKSVAITLAFMGFGVSALVIAELAMRLVGSVVYLLLYPWPVGISLRFRDLSSLVKFGLPFQASAWVGLVNGAIIPIYIGNFPGPGGWSGAQAVGFLIFAAGLAGFARIFSEIIGQLVFPVVSRAQRNIKKIRNSLERALEVAALTSFGLVAVVFVLSEEIIYIIYTDKWLPALPVLRLLLVQSAEVSIGLILLNALLALGASRTFLKMHVLWAVMQWVLTVPLVLYLGFVGLGWASVIVSATGIVLPLILLMRRVRFAFYSKVLPAAGIGLVTMILTFMMKRIVVIDSIWMLLVIGGAAAFSYGLLVYLTMRQTLLSNIAYLWSLLKKREE